MIVEFRSILLMKQLHQSTNKITFDKEAVCQFMCNHVAHMPAHLVDKELYFDAYNANNPILDTTLFCVRPSSFRTPPTPWILHGVDWRLLVEEQIPK